MFLYANDVNACNLCNEYTYVDLKVLLSYFVGLNTSSNNKLF